MAKATFVAVVTRQETVDGLDCYVVVTRRQGYNPAEDYYRKTDLAYYLRKDPAGNILVRNTPPQLLLAWPLEVGKQWQETSTSEQPQIRKTETFRTVTRVEATETVIVPAGTFATFKLVVRDNRTGQVSGEYWYAPEVRYFVRWAHRKHPLRAY